MIARRLEFVEEVRAQVDVGERLQKMPFVKRIGSQFGVKRRYSFIQIGRNRFTINPFFGLHIHPTTPVR